jgi:hypothetical protein
MSCTSVIEIKTLIVDDNEWLSLKPDTIVWDEYSYWQLKNLDNGLPQAWQAIDMTRGGWTTLYSPVEYAKNKGGKLYVVEKQQKCDIYNELERLLIGEIE